MTLFTAEGILVAKDKGSCDIATEIYYAYLGWLETQGYKIKKGISKLENSWLLEIKELYAKRAPGMSCISSLLSGKQGTVESPINNSKGCGGVMRVAPIGLLYPKERAFNIAVASAAITHGHPSGYLSAGALAYLIACIIEGIKLEGSVSETINELKKHKGHGECTKLINKAVVLSNDNKDSVEAISELGQGWVGEEALAIAIYCALKYKNDFNKAICTAVNHDGDSDSTGAITGNILGAYLGINNIPKHWIEKVELIDVLTKMADDLLIEIHEA
jgi:ADP-ribosylglycohydrolase